MGYKTLNDRLVVFLGLIFIGFGILLIIHELLIWIGGFLQLHIIVGLYSDFDL